MAKKDDRPYEFRIKELELEVQDRERELLAFREELGKINNQLENFLDQMAHQVRMALLIQKFLVPTDIPTIPGFEFSRKIVASQKMGGDYFDIFELEDKMKFAILMSNSSGHAMASLFLSVLLKLTSQIEARKGNDPAQVMKKMSDEILERAPEFKNQASHVFYALVDRRDLSLTYSMSGNILAYAYKYDAGKFVKLPSTQGPMGESAKSFKKEALPLEARDRLVLVSPGLLKVQNKKGETFAEERLAKVLAQNTTASPHELRNEIHFQIKEFAQGVEYPQDLSVVVMNVKDKVLKLKKT